MLVPVAVDSPRRYTGAMTAIDERACGKPGCDNIRAPDIPQELSLLCRHLRGLQHQLEIGVKGRHAVLMCHESPDVPFVVLLFLPHYSA